MKTSVLAVAVLKKTFTLPAILKPSQLLLKISVQKLCLKTTPAVTVKETASSQDVTKQESTVVTETQTETVESETSCESSEPETVQTEVQNTQPETAAQPSYTFANGRITNTSALKKLPCDRCFL